MGLSEPIHRPRPTGIERRLGDDELVVSKTDLQGRITYANRVFCRLSGYTTPELLGAPHSIIRHPDMPRAVFKLLWSELEAGREVFAYVINLARTGDHYWVLAHVTPSRDARGRTVGYHSNRRAPAAAAVRDASALYARLLAEERRQPDRRRALEASWTLLEEELRAAGLTYPELVWRWTSAAGAAA